MHIISGIYRYKQIIVPKGEQTRPTTSKVREAVFNICQNIIEGASFLDLYAGSGAMGLEALSRGADFICFVENHKESLRTIDKNILSFTVEKKSKVIRSDVFKALEFLHKMGDCYDVIYADPPYYQKDFEDRSICKLLIEMLDKYPLLKKGGKLFIESPFNYEPDLLILKNLLYINSRKIGKANLLQFSCK